MIKASKDFVLSREKKDQVNAAAAATAAAATAAVDAAATAVVLVLPPFLVFFGLSRRPPQHIKHLRQPMRIQHSQPLFQPLSALPLPPSFQGEEAMEEGSCDCGPGGMV